MVQVAVRQVAEKKGAVQAVVVAGRGRGSSKCVR